MIIDPSRVNLSEKDIEDYLFAHPEALDVFAHGSPRWIKRQYQVPSGIIDLLGATVYHTLVVVEIKNTPIDAHALTQVCRYAYDISEIAGTLAQDLLPYNAHWPQTMKIVIGRTIDTKTLREAEALNINVFCFETKLTVEIGGPVCWTREFQDERRQQHNELSHDPDLIAVMLAYGNDCAEQARQAELSDLEAQVAQASTVCDLEPENVP